MCWNILQGMKKILIMITQAAALTMVIRKMISVSFMIPYLITILISSVIILTGTVVPLQPGGC